MKTKLGVIALIMLSSAGCMTTTNSYTRDIVYRDGSYYSPADEQYGDYYYEPEPDYSYSAYDDYYLGYGVSSSYYNSAWYGGNNCRYASYYDRYCNNTWGSDYLNFGGITLIFGNSNYYGYYGYGGYPYYGGHSPRPHHNGPTPMPKPRPQGNFQILDQGPANMSGIRVSGEPIRIATKPGRINQNSAEPVGGQPDLNPYTRTREPRRPNTRPENWRNDREDTGIVIGDDGVPMHTKPALMGDDGNDDRARASVRQSRRPQPYPVQADSTDGNQPVTVADYSNSDTAPAERVRQNRQERAAPRIQQRERSERVERVERSERSVRLPRRESSDDGKRSN